MNDTTGFLFRKPEGVPCTVYLPRDTKPIGTILFLHGRGECGTDGTRSLLVGLPRWLMLEPHRWPFAVIIPQKPDELLPWHHYEKAVMAHVDAAISDHNLDNNRVALTGLSQGGNGAMRIGAVFAERFRAVVPVCGFPRFFHTEPESEDAAIVAEVADKLANTPVRLYHGEADDVILPEESIKLHKALQERGSSAVLELYPGVNHNSWDKAYGESDLPEWFAEILAR
ncbi:MAG: prolyl oligopeptidase family serine peptidase [Planctomycetota bacterium]